MVCAQIRPFFFLTQINSKTFFSTPNHPHHPPPKQQTENQSLKKKPRCGLLLDRKLAWTKIVPGIVLMIYWCGWSLCSGTVQFTSRDGASAVCLFQLCSRTLTCNRWVTGLGVSRGWIRLSVPLSVRKVPKFRIFQTENLASIFQPLV